jgi:hypothetical protein
VYLSSCAETVRAAIVALKGKLPRYKLNQEAHELLTVLSWQWLSVRIRERKAKPTAAAEAAASEKKD